MLVLVPYFQPLFPALPFPVQAAELVVEGFGVFMPCITVIISVLTMEIFFYLSARTFFTIFYAN